MDLPDKWKITPLSDICQFKPPKSIPRTELAAKAQVSFVPMNDLGEISKDFTATDTRPLESVIKGYTYFADGDVICAKITPCFENGKLGLAQGLSNGVGFGSSEFVVMRTSPKLEAEYLYYFLARDEFREAGQKVMSGAVGHKRVPKEYFEMLPIPLPPLEEQKRIVAVLDQAFTALDRARAHAEANLADAGELFEVSVGEIFEALSENHANEALADIAEKITKGSSPKWQGISYVDEPGVLFVTSENVTANAMDFTKTKYVEDAFNEKDKKSILQRDDVLTNIVGASIGRTAVFDRDDIANINQAVCLIRPDREKLRSSYLAYLLNSPFFKVMLHAGEVNMARANLSLTFFRDFRVPLPSIEDQDAAVSQIEELHQRSLNLSNHYQTKLTDLADLRQSVLQKAFSGQLK
ncbi:restriction endonuclease subunit S [Litoreibacter arenae]|nr:restriction endonuclease subunit S [Litoreibacter arenae]